MTHNSLPNFAQLNAKLAVDNQRVNQWIDGLVERIDSRVDATTRSDWMEVKRLSQFIASPFRDSGSAQRREGDPDNNRDFVEIECQQA